jgi:hypothetical protein
MKLGAPDNVFWMIHKFGTRALAHSATGFHVDENVGNRFMTGDAGQ